VLLTWLSNGELQDLNLFRNVIGGRKVAISFAVGSVLRFTPIVIKFEPEAGT
jgi:hypothetical protein